MMSDGRVVYIPDENVMGEIVSEQLEGAYIKYILGGFEVTEFLTKDDYEVLDYFDEED
jgi:hypothetical protein